MHNDPGTPSAGVACRAPTLPIYEMPGHLVRRLHQIAVALFMEETRAFGITPVQYAALTAAACNPGIDQRRLSRMIAYDRSTIGDVVNRLEKKGLLRRMAGRDRRTKSIFLTGPGETIFAGMEQPVRRSQRDLLGRLSEGERHILMFLLKKLVDLNNDMSRVPVEFDGEGGAPNRRPRRGARAKTELSLHREDE